MFKLYCIIYIVFVSLIVTLYSISIQYFWAGVSIIDRITNDYFNLSFSEYVNVPFGLEAIQRLMPPNIFSEHPSSHFLANFYSYFLKLKVYRGGLVCCYMTMNLSAFGIIICVTLMFLNLDKVTIEDLGDYRSFQVSEKNWWFMLIFWTVISWRSYFNLKNWWVFLKRRLVPFSVMVKLWWILVKQWDSARNKSYF